MLVLVVVWFRGVSGFIDLKIWTLCWSESLFWVMKLSFAQVSLNQLCFFLEKSGDFDLLYLLHYFAELLLSLKRLLTHTLKQLSQFIVSGYVLVQVTLKKLLPFPNQSASTSQLSILIPQLADEILDLPSSRSSPSRHAPISSFSHTDVSATSYTLHLPCQRSHDTLITSA